MPKRDRAATGQPRVPPLEPAEHDAATDELLKMVGDLADLNVFLTLVRHPRVFKRLVPFGTVMLHGTIPARDRELLILRTAHRCGCVYEWSHHEHIAVERGLNAAEIAAVRLGPDEGSWSAFDAALLRAVDELHDNHRIADATWQTLGERYDQRQLIEVPMLIGHYHLMAFTLNSLGVPLEAQYVS